MSMNSTCLSIFPHSYSHKHTRIFMRFIKLTQGRQSMCGIAEMFRDTNKLLKDSKLNYKNNCLMNITS